MDYGEELDALRPGSADTGRLTPQRPLSRASPAPSSSGASTDDEDELNELDDEGARRSSITQPALVTPTALSSPGSPWPFQAPGAPKRGALNGSIASTAVLSTRSRSGTLNASAPPISPSLPHEILLHILKLVHSTADLRTCLVVCKSWCQCGVELLWHKPSFHKVEPLRKTLLVLSAPNQTFPYAIFIKRLNFSALAPEGINDPILRQLTACARLERLTIAGNAQVTDAGVTAVLNVCKGLVALDVSECTEVTDATCLAAAENCRKLQGLNLSGCKEVTDVGVNAIAESCTALRRIKLRHLDKLSDTPIVLLARNCTHLLEVDIIGCNRVSDISMWAIWRSLKGLRELSLSSCSEISDAGLPQREKLNNVTQVVLRGQELLSGLPPSVRGAAATKAIKNMRISGELKMSLLTPVNPSHFTHLRYLDLTALTRLTDEGIAGIVDCIPKMRNLILAKCLGLTDEALRSVCKLGKHLHYLHLGHVANITDAAVTDLARSCTRLRYIDLACCPNLTDLSVTELAQNLPRLKRIGLVRVTHLTDEAIFALRERTSLERIHLSYCERITVQPIAFLLQHLRKLTHLSLTGVPSFRRSDLQQFCRQPPKDFNQHQRAAFCVYSGSGVAQLRDYLLTGFGNGRQMPVFGNGSRNLLPRADAYMPFRMGPFGTQQVHMHGGPGFAFAGHTAAAHQAAQAAHLASLQQDMDEDDELDEASDDGETIAGDPVGRMPHHSQILPGTWQAAWNIDTGPGSAPASLTGHAAVPTWLHESNIGASTSAQQAVQFEDDEIDDESELEMDTT